MGIQDEGKRREGEEDLPGFIGSRILPAILGQGVLVSGAVVTVYTGRGYIRGYPPNPRHPRSIKVLTL